MCLSKLREIRESLGAPLIHLNQKIKPAINSKHFLLYNPNNPNNPNSKFHFMFCEGLKNANLSKYRRTNEIDENFLMSDGSRMKLNVCGFCRHEWNEKFPNDPTPKPFNIENFFRQCAYHPEAWGRIITKTSKRKNCFLLYNPVRGVPNFHFMKCSDILDKEQTGWIKTYRFTHNLSGSFYVYNKYKALFERQFIRPCEKCLSEWNNGQGYKNYSNVNEEEKNKIISSFNIIDFFDSCDENRPELAELYKLMENNKVWLDPDIDNKYPENWKFTLSL